MMRGALLVCLLAGGLLAQSSESPLYESNFIFPLETWHNHSSSIVELPNGDLFACWFHGSGERTADDVLVQAARLPKGSTQWSERYTLADTPNFPDTNPALLVDSKGRLMLFWPTIIANLWETALMKYRITEDATTDPIEWRTADNLLFIPRNFQKKVTDTLTPYLALVAPGSDEETYLKTVIAMSADKYASRMGWMTRVHPLELPSGRLLVPLYSDGFNFSIIAISDDGGKTWTSSEPLVGIGNVQPSLVRKQDGTIVAYMRDNGPPPQRAMMATSRDEGVTWSAVTDSEILNPGTSLEVIALRDGTWVMAYNDLENGRWSLVLAMSDDEGASWKWKRHLDVDTRAKDPASYQYPSIIQAADGTLHITYSYHLNYLSSSSPRKTIKYVHLNTAWIREGDK